jgi:hypothetical protein
LRIDGVTPAAAIILLGFIKKKRYKVSAWWQKKKLNLYY